jgi:hypothetical protein
VQTATRPTKNGKWRKTGARRLRVGTAIAILATAACVDDAASSKTERNDGKETKAASTRMTPAIEIAALDGTLPTDADLFAGMLQEETSRVALPRNTSLGLAGALGTGENSDGTYMVAVIDVRSADGARLHRVVNETLVPENTRPGNDSLRHFAKATARKISEWYAASSSTPAEILVRAVPGESERIVTGSIATPKSFEIEIGPSPGDGTVSLANALETALLSQMETVAWRGPHAFRVEGSVIAASRNDGRTDVSIEWVVKSAKGKVLGKVHQKNDLNAERIAGEWGKVAEKAAEAAAKGVLTILGPSPDSLPGPMAANS